MVMQHLDVATQTYLFPRVAVFFLYWSLCIKSLATAAGVFVHRMALNYMELGVKRHFDHEEEVRGRGVLAADRPPCCLFSIGLVVTFCFPGHSWQ